MLLDTLKQDLTVSLKNGDSVRVETLRYLLAAVQNALIAKYGNAAEKSAVEQDITDVIKKQVKTHKESIEAFGNAHREDFAIG